MSELVKKQLVCPENTYVINNEAAETDCFKKLSTPDQTLIDNCGTPTETDSLPRARASSFATAL